MLYSSQMSLFIVGGFLVCWIPYHSAMIVITFGLAQDKVREWGVREALVFSVTGHIITEMLVHHKSGNWVLANSS